MNKKYKYILFDADNTLFDFDVAEKKAFLSLGNIDSAVFREENYRLYHEINDSAWKRLERGEITKPQLKRLRFTELYGALLLNPCEKLIDTVVNEYPKMLARGTDLIDGALDTVRCLSSEYSIYIVTNGLYDVQSARLAASPVSEYVRELFVSEKIGFEKPSTRFFDFVFKSVGDLDKDSYIVIGDSLSSDIDGACASGIDSVYFDRASRGTQGRDPTYVIKKLTELFDIIPVDRLRGISI